MDQRGHTCAHTSSIDKIRRGKRWEVCRSVEDQRWPLLTTGSRPNSGDDQRVVVRRWDQVMGRPYSMVAEIEGGAIAPRHHGHLGVLEKTLNGI